MNDNFDLFSFQSDEDGFPPSSESGSTSTPLTNVAGPIGPTATLCSTPAKFPGVEGDTTGYRARFKRVEDCHVDTNLDQPFLETMAAISLQFGLRREGALQVIRADPGAGASELLGQFERVPGLEAVVGSDGRRKERALTIRAGSPSDGLHCRILKTIAAIPRMAKDKSVDIFANQRSCSHAADELKSQGVQIIAIEQFDRLLAGRTRESKRQIAGNLVYLMTSAAKVSIILAGSQELITWIDDEWDLAARAIWWSIEPLRNTNVDEAKKFLVEFAAAGELTVDAVLLKNEALKDLVDLVHGARGNLARLLRTAVQNAIMGEELRNYHLDQARAQMNPYRGCQN